MQPFDELRAEVKVLEIKAELRAARPASAACLDRAFDQIHDGRLSLRHFGTEPHLFYTVACGHMILVSDLGATGVVVGLLKTDTAEIEP